MKGWKNSAGGEEVDNSSPTAGERKNRIRAGVSRSFMEPLEEGSLLQEVHIQDAESRGRNQWSVDSGRWTASSIRELLTTDRCHLALTYGECNNADTGSKRRTSDRSWFMMNEP